MNDNAETLLDRIDEILGALDPAELQAGMGLEDVERDIVQQLANAFYGVEDANTYQFLATTLVLDETSWADDTAGE